MKFIVWNQGFQPVVIESRDGPVMDISIQDGISKDILVSWSAQYPEKVAHHLEWKPGEIKTIEMDWTATREQATRNVSGAGLLNQGSTTLSAVGGLIDVYYGP
ncbi:MAG: hypothetical protein WCF84_03335 [Anaerolineae bacterium]